MKCFDVQKKQSFYSQFDVKHETKNKIVGTFCKLFV